MTLPGLQGLAELSQSRDWGYSVDIEKKGRGLGVAWLRAWGRSRGQALVEFGILAPVLLLLMSGVLDLGRAYYYEILSSDATRDGARVAAGNYGGVLGVAGPTQDAVCNQVKVDLADIGGTTCTFVNHAPPFQAGTDYHLPTANKAVAIIYCPNSAPNNCGVTQGAPQNLTLAVQVNYGFSLVTPIVDSLVPGSVIQMSDSAQMVSNW